MLQEKANVFASRFGILNFNCSASLISRFTVTPRIVLGKISGKSSCVDQSSTTNLGDHCVAKITQSTTVLIFKPRHFCCKHEI